MLFPTARWYIVSFLEILGKISPLGIQNPNLVFSDVSNEVYKLIVNLLGRFFMLNLTLLVTQVYFILGNCQAEIRVERYIQLLERIKKPMNYIDVDLFLFTFICLKLSGAL